MHLSEAVPQDAQYDPRFGNLDLSGVSADSRSVAPGNLFVALAGSRTDGARFVKAAFAAGAAAVMAEQRPADLPADAAFVRVPNARRALALVAARFHPRQPDVIAAVTGTSGKTSVAAFVRQIWGALGHHAASIGTVGVVAPSGETYGSLTTPDPVVLHRTLDRLAGEGVTHLAIEASSHGLDQHRLDGLGIAVGGFTNLSRDHLDYHPTLEAYLAAKLRLFSDLIRPGGAAVVNADDPHGEAVCAVARARGLAVLTVGRGGETVTVESCARDGFAQRLRLRHGGRTFDIRLPLVGAFQADNAVLAAGMVIATGGEPDRVFAALESLQGAKGRLEQVGAYRGAPIFIDYAHKPDALAKALDALRPYARGRLVVVFGAGGDRDQGKRPLMGAIAAERADRIIVTDDNPRSEDPAAIRAAILAAAPGAIEIGDRAEAIRAAIEGLESGDVLLIAGKGHESGQIIGERTVPFTDHGAVAAVLGEKAV
ncbi:MAG: UDP-N-acetylmuramoyl-L-alanyl-D-glutamate--2,6-diaminopimelate ligase [Variibacter sp.]|nr:UDP-N-acetylmuramoyl-L-alanyl-D-glutamate--2,6-diaminopimelate ligase [Variibacter sp.]